MDLTFAEQVKILLKRRKMTIKDLADLIEEHTGKKMSRQNLTQQLGRDNFQEKDMRLIAEVLGCTMQITLVSEELGTAGAVPYAAAEAPVVTGVAASVEGKVVTTLMKHRKKRPILGEVNPLTGEEYSSNTVRTHPVLSGYVQVYDSSEHKWTDLVEAEFLKFQEEKHAMMGKDYEPPIYID